MDNSQQTQTSNTISSNDLKSIPVDLAESALAKVGAPLSGTKAVISWSRSANFVKLSEVDANENETKIVFNVNPSSISKAEFNFNEIKITVNGKSYMLLIRSVVGETAHVGGILTGTGAGAAIAIGTATGKDSGIDDLKNFLSSNSVETVKPRVLKMVLGTVGVMFALLILAYIALQVLAT